jgi:hypothetical protein
MGGEDDDQYLPKRSVQILEIPNFHINDRLKGNNGKSDDLDLPYLSYDGEDDEGD